MPPDLFIPIDYPDFNLRLASIAQRQKVPVLYYISPQIWAWRQNRVKTIARLVDEMAVILPFEEKFYKNHGVEATFVGHPLLDIMPLDQTEEEPIIGLLPGSRIGEIKCILPIMLKTAALIYERRTELRFILPVAPTLDIDWLKQFVTYYQPDFPLTIAQDNDYAFKQQCCFLIVASGTATLETAILLKPFVIVYHLSPWSYILGKRLVKVPYIGLVNWIAGRKIIPEFIQYQARPELIAQKVLSLLANPEKLRQIKEALKVLQVKLGTPGVAERVARLAKGILQR
jgi:lipid-A-disaccharide synthase